MWFAEAFARGVVEGSAFIATVVLFVLVVVGVMRVATSGRFFPEPREGPPDE